MRHEVGSLQALTLSTHTTTGPHPPPNITIMRCLVLLHVVASALSTSLPQSRLSPRVLYQVTCGEDRRACSPCPVYTDCLCNLYQVCSIHCLKQNSCNVPSKETLTVCFTTQVCCQRVLRRPAGTGPQSLCPREGNLASSQFDRFDLAFPRSERPRRCSLQTNFFRGRDCRSRAAALRTHSPSDRSDARRWRVTRLCRTACPLLPTRPLRRPSRRTMCSSAAYGIGGHCYGSGRLRAPRQAAVHRCCQRAAAGAHSQRASQAASKRVGARMTADGVCIYSICAADLALPAESRPCGLRSAGACPGRGQQRSRRPPAAT